MSAGIPIKLLHEGEGNPVTVELKTGEVYRGFLLSAEDNMSCQLSKVTLTHKDGRISKLEHVYLRGSQVRLFVLPDLLTNGPLFKKVQQIKANYDAAQASKPGGSYTAVALTERLVVKWCLPGCLVCSKNTWMIWMILGSLLAMCFSLFAPGRRK